ncbi:MAG TPA: proteasome subunit alpha, partial [Pilimelia sp.]|nr:proteasome subunit alpha [Pilimelia sp.]
PGRMAMGGHYDAIGTVLRDRHQPSMSLDAALHLAVEALASVGGDNGKARTLAADQLEVAVLDRRRAGRTFRRITGRALTTLLEPPPAAADADGAGSDTPEADTAAGS